MLIAPHIVRPGLWMPPSMRRARPQHSRVAPYTEWFSNLVKRSGNLLKTASGHLSKGCSSPPGTCSQCADGAPVPGTMIATLTGFGLCPADCSATAQEIQFPDPNGTHVLTYQTGSDCIWSKPNLGHVFITSCIPGSTPVDNGSGTNSVLFFGYNLFSGSFPGWRLVIFYSTVLGNLGASAPESVPGSFSLCRSDTFVAGTWTNATGAFNSTCTPSRGGGEYIGTPSGTVVA